MILVWNRIRYMCFISDKVINDFFPLINGMAIELRRNIWKQVKGGKKISLSFIAYLRYLIFCSCSVCFTIY